jgi:lysophosphatidate acyltransferase
MLPFKKGPFHLAVAAQLPIVPIVCENYAPLYSSQRKHFESGDLVIKGEWPLSRFRACATHARQLTHP